jgi:hypothetical protein
LRECFRIVFVPFHISALVLGFNHYTGVNINQKFSFDFKSSLLVCLAVKCVNLLVKFSGRTLQPSRINTNFAFRECSQAPEHFQSEYYCLIRVFEFSFLIAIFVLLLFARLLNEKFALHTNLILLNSQYY